MRRSALLGLAALLLAAHSAGAQPAAPAPPDVPAGPGAIRGEIVHREEPSRSLGGIPVVLYALTRTGVLGLRRAVSGDDGRFAFEGISNDPSTPYLVGAKYQGVPYSAARVLFAPGELEHEVEVRVADVTEKAEQLRVTLARLRVDWLGGRLRVLESLTVRNGSPRTLHVPPEARSASPPPFRAELPAGATELAMPHGLTPEGVEHRDGEVAFWGPIYPGEQDLSFSYTLPASGETVAIDALFPIGAERVEVVVPAGGLAPSGGSLTETESKSLDGRSFRTFEGPPVAPGGRLAFRLDLPEARIEPDALEVAEVRLLLGLDDAALDVRETHVLRVEGEAGVMPAPGEPLLRIQLPEAVQNLRFSSDAAGLTLAPSSDGGIAVGGVALPGESAVRVDYRIPVAENSVDLVRSFGRRVPLLGVYLADTGRLIPESARLHRRRPVRTGDLTYIHLEGFNVAPGEEVALHVSTRPPGRGGRPGGVVAFVLLAGVLSVALLVAPLLRGGLGPQEAGGEELPSVRERESIYDAIRDLEHDHETGKISEEDYTGMRNELRARAVDLLRRERESAAERETAGASPHCPSCEAEVGATDRFCSRCGAALTTRREGEG